MESGPLRLDSPRPRLTMSRLTVFRLHDGAKRETHSVETVLPILIFSRASGVWYDRRCVRCWQLWAHDQEGKQPIHHRGQCLGILGFVFISQHVYKRPPVSPASAKNKKRMAATGASRLMGGAVSQAHKCSEHV